MSMTFTIPRLMRWSGNAITDHNRQPLSITVNRIEKATRMANGTMRKLVIADKRTFSTSWEGFPKKTSQTVDGFWGGTAIESFYNTTTGPFSLEITDADGGVSTYQVNFTEFTKEIDKRGSIDLWTVSVSMEEV